MEGYSVQLPLTIDKIDGPYALNKDLTSVAKQNLKMLVLTSPGERIMIPLFGVGIRQFLFQAMNSMTEEAIRGRIQDQVETFLPYIELYDVQINQNETQTHKDLYTLSVKIFYTLNSLGIQDSLDIQVE